MQQIAQPFSQKTIIRFLVVVIIVLAFFAGYLEASVYTYKRRLQILQTRCNAQQAPVQNTQPTLTPAPTPQEAVQ